MSTLTPEASLATEVPLCVDLDGTLISTDVLLESIIALVKRNPAYLFMLPIWFMKGKAALKFAIARHASIEVALLPYHRDLLAFLRDERRRGRKLVLVTAANERLARQVADHIGEFSDVLASDERINLSGTNKARALQLRFGSKGYDYAANAPSDLRVWADARQAILVNSSGRVADQARQVTSVGPVFEGVSDIFGQIARVLRIHHWAKNLLVFVPLITSHNLTQTKLVLSSLLAFAAFSLCASAGYVVNDLADLEADRGHPTKKYRPFASGKVPLALGLAIPLIFLCASLFVALALPRAFGHALGLYLILTLGYSFYFKRFPLVDVMLLAALYLIRIFAGAAAIGVPVSHWLLGFAMFLLVSIAFLKRFSELRLAILAQTEAIKGRGYLAGDLGYVATVGLASGYISALVLALYVSSPEVSRLYSRPEFLWLICPVLLYWISRVWLLAHRNQMHEDPIAFAVRDVPSYIVAALAAVIMILAKYG